VLFTLSVAILAANIPLPQSAVRPDIAQQLVGGAMASGMASARLEELTDGIGARLSGSPGAAAAVQWAQKKFREDGLSVRLEPVKVPHWVRGIERGEVLAAPGIAEHRIALTALGGSVPTPDGGVEGEVVEVHALSELGPQVKGKLVFFNHTMSVGHDYGRFVELRVRGPAQAGKFGATGVLLRSLSTASFTNPHTGVTIYDAQGPRIPAVAISTEDAELLHRLLRHSTPPRVRFELTCKWLPDADSFNVVAEVRGREKPQEVVLLGAHLDSWDLAQGANDDGAGVAMVMEAGRLIRSLRQAPRRTVRVVLFMNEENGSMGSKAYAQAHGAEPHVAAIECDSGAARPIAVTVHGGPGAIQQITPWIEPLRSLELKAVEGEAGGADISPLGQAGVPFVAVTVDNTHYFDIHHSQSDTFDKVDPEALAKDAAAVAVVAYGLAEMPEPLARPQPQASTH
jgi:Iap family predicted aminopeptidase